MFIDEAYTALGIFPVFPPACCLLHFAAFFIYFMHKAQDILISFIKQHNIPLYSQRVSNKYFTNTEQRQLLSFPNMKGERYVII